MHHEKSNNNPNQDVYEVFADQFLTSLAGKASGLTRDQVIANLKDLHPDPAAFQSTMDRVKAVVEAKMGDLDASIRKGGQMQGHFDLSEAMSLLRSQAPSSAAPADLMDKATAQIFGHLSQVQQQHKPISPHMMLSAGLVALQDYAIEAGVRNEDFIDLLEMLIERLKRRLPNLS